MRSRGTTDIVGVQTIQTCSGVVNYPSLYICSARHSSYPVSQSIYWALSIIIISTTATTKMLKIFRGIYNRVVANI